MLGDTTAYSIAWFLLEILRPENARYNLVQRARDDIQTTGVNEYLDYGESTVGLTASYGVNQVL